MSRSGVIDTALFSDDDDPQLTSDGYGVITPNFDESEMLEALESPDAGEAQAELEPQDAYEMMKFMAPLDGGEEELLEDTPFITPGPENPYGGGMRFIDDADHDEWLFERQGEKGAAMDDAFEDQMFGEVTEEEAMDLAGTEVGKFRPGRFIKKVGRGIGKGAKGVGRGIKATGKFIKKTLTAPARAMVRKFRSKLVKRRANYVAHRSGRRTPNLHDTQQANVWAKTWLNTKGGKYGRALSSLSGWSMDDTMGSAAGTVALMAALAAFPLPTLMVLLAKTLTSAGKQGAPADPGPVVAPGQTPPPDPGDAASPDDDAAPPAADEPSPADDGPPAPADDGPSPDDGAPGDDVAPPEEASGAISPDVYTEAVRCRARRMAGGRSPSPAQVQRARADVDNFLRTVCRR